MKDNGHFPMCENPENFKQYLMPVLDKIRGQAESRSSGQRGSAAR
jgi:hypothetical protein